MKGEIADLPRNACDVSRRFRPHLIILTFVPAMGTISFRFKEHPVTAAPRPRSIPQQRPARAILHTHAPPLYSTRRSSPHAAGSRDASRRRQATSRRLIDFANPRPVACRAVFAQRVEGCSVPGPRLRAATGPRPGPAIWARGGEASPRHRICRINRAAEKTLYIKKIPLFAAQRRTPDFPHKPLYMLDIPSNVPHESAACGS